MAEAEVFAFVDLGGVDGVAEDGGGEIARGHVAEGFGEGEDEGGVEASGGEEFELAGEWGEERVRVVRAEDSGGVGVEGDGQGLAGEGAGAGDDFGDDGAMAEVDAVEVADSGDDRGGRGGEIGELGVDAH